MRINQKQSLYESFQNKLKEDSLPNYDPYSQPQEVIDEINKKNFFLAKNYQEVLDDYENNINSDWYIDVIKSAQDSIKRRKDVEKEKDLERRYKWAKKELANLRKNHSTQVDRVESLYNFIKDYEKSHNSLEEDSDIKKLIKRGNTYIPVRKGETDAVAIKRAEDTTKPVSSNDTISFKMPVYSKEFKQALLKDRDALIASYDPSKVDPEVVKKKIKNGEELNVQESMWFLNQGPEPGSIVLSDQINKVAPDGKWVDVNRYDDYIKDPEHNQDAIEDPDAEPEDDIDLEKASKEIRELINKMEKNKAEGKYEESSKVKSAFKRLKESYKPVQDMWEGPGTYYINAKAVTGTSLESSYDISDEEQFKKFLSDHPEYIENNCKGYLSKFHTHGTSSFGGKYWNNAKLNESYAIVNYYDENGEPKEKQYNGSKQSVLGKVKRLADRYEIIDIHQASKDLGDDKYLNSLGKGVLRVDNWSSTFEEPDFINEEDEIKHEIPEDVKECIENGLYEDRNIDIKYSLFHGDMLIVESRAGMTEDTFDKIVKRINYYFNSYGVVADGGIEDDGNKVLALECYMPDDAFKEYKENSDDYKQEDEDFYMLNKDTDEKVHVYKDGNRWYDTDGNRYMGYLSKSDVKAYFKGNWEEI